MDKKQQILHLYRVEELSLRDIWKTRARVTPRADKALTPDIFYD